MILTLSLLLIFAATWLAVAGALMLACRPSLADRRLATMLAPAPDEALPGPGATSVLDPLLGSGALAERARVALWRAGLTMRPTDFLALVLVAALAAGGAALAITRLPLAAAAASLAGALAPAAYHSIRQAQRRAQFEAQLPDTLATMVSSLRTGYTFQQALLMVAEEVPSPMGAEARRVVDELRLGLDLETALAHMVDRVQSYDVDLIATAVAIQHQVGGNLASLLETIGDTVRERLRTRSEVAALTAEGRLSALVLFLLPLVLLAVLAARSPDYISPLFHHPLGRAMLGGALVLQLAGGVVLHRMLRVEE